MAESKEYTRIVGEADSELRDTTEFLTPKEEKQQMSCVQCAP